MALRFFPFVFHGCPLKHAPTVQSDIMVVCWWAGVDAMQRATRSFLAGSRRAVSQHTLPLLFDCIDSLNDYLNDYLPRPARDKHRENALILETFLQVASQRCDSVDTVC